MPNSSYYRELISLSGLFLQWICSYTKIQFYFCDVCSCSL